MRLLPPMLTPDVATRILNGDTEVSLDLGLSVSTISGKGDLFEIMGYRVSRFDLGDVAKKENAVFFPQGDTLFQVAIADNGFFKLVPTDGAPTLEIDGVRMHRTKDTTPDADTRDKLNVLGLCGGKVLDTCMGLGYTAIGAIDKGAEVVISIERQPSVIRITQMNPWSRRLFEGDVSLIVGDSYYTIDSFPVGFFDWVIHDPPRLTHAGSLYGEEFYTKIFKVMASGGRLFHYTGEPRSRYRGVDLQNGIQRRLRAAGFKGTEYHSIVMGVTSEKP